MDVYEVFLNSHELTVHEASLPMTYCLWHQNKMILDHLFDKPHRIQAVQEFCRRLKNGQYNHIFVTVST